MTGEQILTIVEDLQRECISNATDEFMACLDKIHKYVEAETEREKETAKTKTRAFIADRSFDKYKNTVGQAI